MMSIGSPEYIAYAQGCVEGAEAERAKILEELHQLLSDEVKDVAGDMDRARGIEMAIALIQKKPLEELRRLAEETGEYEHSDNPLIDKDYNRLDNPIIGGVQKLNDLLGIIGK